MVINPDGSFMGVIERVMVGVWNIWSTDMQFPQPLGAISPGDIILFFACCYMIADAMTGIAERRD